MKIDIFHYDWKAGSAADQRQHFAITFNGGEDPGHVQQAWKAGLYKRVATVETAGDAAADPIAHLERAFHQTNHIDSDWKMNSDVTAYQSKNRSTSVGDVLLMDGQYWVVDTMGFSRIGLINLPESS